MDGEDAYSMLTSIPSFKMIPEEKKAALKEKFLGLYEEFVTSRGGLGLDFEILYLIAYK